MYGVLVSRSDARERLMRCNLRTVNRPTRCFYRLYRPTRCFTVCTDRTDRKIVSLLIKFNEMQFTDCQQTDLLFYNPYRLYRSSNCFTPSSTNRCIQLPDCQRIDVLGFQFDRPYRSYDRFDRLYQCAYIGHEWNDFKDNS